MAGELPTADTAEHSPKPRKHGYEPRNIYRLTTRQIQHQKSQEVESLMTGTRATFAYPYPLHAALVRLAAPLARKYAIRRNSGLAPTTIYCTRATLTLALRGSGVRWLTSRCHRSGYGPRGSPSSPSGRRFGLLHPPGCRFPSGYRNVGSFGSRRFAPDPDEIVVWNGHLFEHSKLNADPAGAKCCSWFSCSNSPSAISFC